MGIFKHRLYTSSTLERLDNGCVCLMLPWQWSVQKIVSSFRSTTKEVADRFEEPCYERYVILSFVLPGLVIFLTLYFPIYGIAVVIWTFIQKNRIGHCEVVTLDDPFDRATPDATKTYCLSAASINACLLPEPEARTLNLGQCQNRARQIAMLLVDPLQVGNTEEGAVTPNPSKKNNVDYGSTELEEQNLIKEGSLKESYSQDNIVSLTFPFDLDLFVIHHVTDRRAEKKLVTITKEKYPYSISRVGINSWVSNGFKESNGIVVLSKLPVFQHRYFPLPSSMKTNKNRSEGLLVFNVALSAPKTCIIVAVFTATKGKNDWQLIFDFIRSCIDQHREEGEADIDIVGEALFLSAEYGESLADGNIQGGNNNSKEYYHPFSILNMAMISDILKLASPPFNSSKKSQYESDIGTDILLRKLYKKVAVDPKSLKSSLQDKCIRNSILLGTDGNLRSIEVFSRESSGKCTIPHYTGFAWILRGISLAHVLPKTTRHVTSSLASIINTLPIVVNFEISIK